MTDSTLIANLIDLLDDPDEAVARCVEERIMQLGREALSAMEKAASDETDPKRRLLIRRRREMFNGRMRTADLKAISKTARSGGFSLYEPVFTISSLLDADLSREQFQESFIACASHFEGEISPQRTALENVEIFNHIFFDRLRFKVVDHDLKSPSNALLTEMLATGRGNPFTVAVLYFLLAEEQHINLLPLCFGGGFVPACVERGEELFCIDTSGGGRIFPSDGLSGKGASLHPRGVIPGIWMESLIETYSLCHDHEKESLVTKALEAYTSERFLDRGEDIPE